MSKISVTEDYDGIKYIHVDCDVGKTYRNPEIEELCQEEIKQKYEKYFGTNISIDSWRENIEELHNEALNQFNTK